jgi:hypothetical protein
MKSRSSSRFTVSNHSNILDFLVGLNPSSPPLSPTGNDADISPPSPDTFDFDAHFGYSPTPSPPPEVANQLTQEQIKMGMYKVEDSGLNSSMGPPLFPYTIRDDVDLRRANRGRATNAGMQGTRKRKERDSDGEENAGTLNRKKSRG